MNEARFASITAALLARKGEAAPSVMDASAAALPFFAPRPARAPRPAVEHTARPAIAASAATADRKRRVVVTLTGEEYVRLGIVAAKKNSTRHDLVRGVLFEQLDVYAAEQGNCACIATGAACACAESAATHEPDATEESAAAADLDAGADIDAHRDFDRADLLPEAALTA